MSVLKKELCYLLTLCILTTSILSSQVFATESENSSDENEVFVPYYDTAVGEEFNTTEYLMGIGQAKDDYINSIDFAYSHISPSMDYELTWNNNGLELYNTEFRMSEELEDKLSDRLHSFPLNQSVMLIELETNMAFTFLGDTKVATASSIKGPMGLFVNKNIDSGRFSWDTMKAYQRRHFQSNSTGRVQNSPYGTTFSVETLMDYMIRISDNQAYLMLKEMVGYTNFNDMMLSFYGTQVIPDGKNWGYITAKEMAAAWREIYYYCSYSDSGAKLFDRFMHAQYNYIWRAIPQYEAAHKSGWSGKAFNDAGVVFADGHQYVLVVLCARNGSTKDSRAQYHFTAVTKLLAELMVEYNLYLEQGINPGV